MILGRVVGEVWASKKHAALDGRKMLLVRPTFWYGPADHRDHLVAIDTVGAGVGEDVIVCLGSPARAQLDSANLPVDAAIAAIVDRVELADESSVRSETQRHP